MEKLNLIYGKHAVIAFIKKYPRMVKKIWLKNKANALQKLQIPFLGIPIEELTEQQLKKLFSEPIHHQGIVAEIKEYNYHPFANLLLELKARSRDLLLVLDQIHDPHNFGAIIRSASLLGVKTIIILDHKQIGVSPTVVKTSSGTVYDVAITRVSNLNNAIRKLKEIGYWVYASNINKSAKDLRKVEFAQKTVLIVGNEATGVSELLTKNSDQNIFIPSTKVIDSFNVSVATAIMLYEIAKKINIF